LLGEKRVTKAVEGRDPEAFEWAARDLFEGINGQGSWKTAKTAQRSEARLWIRTILDSFEKRGWKFDLDGATDADEDSQDSGRRR